MKPYGREKNVKGASWKQDCHPPKGFINWWENICQCVSRKTMKQKIKREIEDENTTN